MHFDNLLKYCTMIVGPCRHVLTIGCIGTMPLHKFVLRLNMHYYIYKIDKLTDLEMAHPFAAFFSTVLTPYNVQEKDQNPSQIKI